MSLFLKRMLGKELSELEIALNTVVIRKDVKSEKEFDKIFNSLRDLLVNTFDAQSQKVISDVIDYLLTLKRENFNSKDIKEINRLLQLNLGTDLSKLTEKRITELTEDLFKFGASEIVESFGVSDNEAIDILSEHNNFWVGNFYSEQIQNPIKETLKEYFDGSKTITEVAVDFEKKFANYSDKGIEYFEGLAEHTSNRIRALGQVTGMEKAGIESYQIVAILDERTSEVCRFMDGKIFQLSRAIDYRDKILSLKSPEDVKKFSAWISPTELTELQEQKTLDSDLPAGLTIPPFHWKCRTTIRVYFTTDAKINYTEVLKEFDKDEYIKRHHEEFNKFGLYDRIKEFALNYGLSKDDVRVINSYTDWGYEKLNKALVGIIPMTKFSITYRNLLNYVLTKLPDFEGEVYRYISSMSEELDAGQIYTELRFLSASTDILSYEYREIGFIIKSKSGKLIKYFSRHPHEQEVLFRSGSKFKVLRKYRKPNSQLVYEMEEL